MVATTGATVETAATMIGARVEEIVVTIETAATIAAMTAIAGMTATAGTIAGVTATAETTVAMTVEMAAAGTTMTIVGEASSAA